MGPATEQPRHFGKGKAQLFPFSENVFTPSRNNKSPNIFKLATLCNVVLKIKAYRSQNRLTQCHNCQCSVNVWVHCRRPTRCLWYKSGHRYR
jgi:hypothetical protein